MPKRLALKCKHCKKKFSTEEGKARQFCTLACRNSYRWKEKGDDHELRKKLPCRHCSEKFFKGNLASHEKVCLSYNKHCQLCKKPFRADNDSVRNLFCSRSCSTIYNNSHKRKGIRRSKLEVFIEKQLGKQYPSLDIDFNKINNMGFELDIHIPSLKLAFEINGIVHYKNIYGQEKYDRIKNNDRNKLVKCYENGINLIVLDTTEQKKFDEESSVRYLETIKTIINHASKQKKPTSIKGELKN